MTEPLRFGWGIAMRNPEQWRRPWADFYAEHIDFLAWAETLGFEGVWLCEHHGFDDGYIPSPLVLGAAIAARTKRTVISTGVALAPHYHPVRLAEDMAVLDLISNGRAQLSLGLGYLDFEARAYGFHNKKRWRMTDEILQIIRRLWQGETVDWSSEFFTLEKARVTPLPIQRPSIPLFVGAATPIGLRRAARLGDGFIGGAAQYGTYVEELRACGKDEADGRIVGMDSNWTVVSEDPEKTVHEVAPHAYYRMITYAQLAEGLDWHYKVMDFDTFKSSGMVKVLTPDEAIAEIKAQLELAPIESFCMHAPAGYPISKLAESAELIANKVIPAFR